MPHPTTPTPESRVHPWERAGLGKAPFRFTGTESYAANHPGGRVIADNGVSQTITKPGTSCDYCGQYIIEAFWIRSADGHRFKVGCDCVAKVEDKRSALRSAVDDARRKADRAKRKAKGAAARAETIRALCRCETRRALRAKPHPSIESKTLLDYAVWMLRRAGVSGATKVARLVRAEVSA